MILLVKITLLDPSVTSIFFPLTTLDLAESYIVQFAILIFELLFISIPSKDVFKILILFIIIFVLLAITMPKFVNVELYPEIVKFLVLFKIEMD